MYTIIGSKNCVKCMMVKKKLDQKNIDYDYKLLEDLMPEERDSYLKIASNSKVSQMPLVFENGEILDLKEVV